MKALSQPFPNHASYCPGTQGPGHAKPAAPVMNKYSSPLPSAPFDACCRSAGVHSRGCSFPHPFTAAVSLPSPWLQSSEQLESSVGVQAGGDPDVVLLAVGARIRDRRELDALALDVRQQHRACVARTNNCSGIAWKFETSTRKRPRNMPVHERGSVIASGLLRPRLSNCAQGRRCARMRPTQSRVALQGGRAALQGGARTNVADSAGAASGLAVQDARFVRLAVRVLQHRRSRVGGLCIVLQRSTVQR